jgi:hypothetical protein
VNRPTLPGLNHVRSGAAQTATGVRAQAESLQARAVDILIQGYGHWLELRAQMPEPVLMAIVSVGKVGTIKLVTRRLPRVPRLITAPLLELAIDKAALVSSDWFHRRILGELEPDLAALTDREQAAVASQLRSLFGELEATFESYPSEDQRAQLLAILWAFRVLHGIPNVTRDASVDPAAAASALVTAIDRMSADDRSRLFGVLLGILRREGTVSVDTTAQTLVTAHVTADGPAQPHEEGYPS